jgi:hypothetical protein
VLLEWSATTQSLDIRQNIRPSFGFFDGASPATSQRSTSDGIQSSFPQGGPSDGTAFQTTSVATAGSTNANLVSPYRMRTDTPVHDRGMADTYSEAWQNRADFWNEHATARINGNASLPPGVNISVQVSGTPNGRNDYDGVWLVRGVKHVLTHTSFQTLLDLARDRTVLPVNANHQWFWNTPRGNPKVIRDPMTNKWKSSWGSSPEFINTTLTV